MDKIETLEQAMEWFIKNNSGTCICHKGDKTKKCITYEEAREFYENEM